MRTAGVFVATALVFAIGAAPARADGTKAWAAAKQGLPSDTRFVVGIDVAAIHKSQLFAQYYPKLIAKQDAASALATMKAACNVDPTQALQGVVVAFGADPDDGAVYVSLAGIDRAKLSSCLSAAVANNDQTVKVTVKNDGNVTEVTKGDTTNYFGWIGKDVVVLPYKSSDKASIARWSTGKGAFAKSVAGKLLARTSTSGVVWFAGEKPKAADLGADFKTGYGVIKYDGAMYDADLHGQMGTADAATTFVTQATAQLEQGKKLAAVSPSLNSVLNAIRLGNADTDVSVKAKVTELDLINVLAMVAP